MSKSITVPESYMYGVGMLQRNLATLIPAVLVVGAVSMVVAVLSSMILGPLAFIPATLVSAFLGASLLQMTLDLHDGKSVALGQLFKPHERVVPFLIVTIITSISGMLVVVPLLLTMAPGLALEGKASAIEALQRSVTLTIANPVTIILFLIAAAILNTIGTIPLGLGLLATIPITMMAYVRLYRSLT